jgi:D-alanyl-D-alanine carboxypeptidase (penicillin-binding protein 5/6)
MMNARAQELGLTHTRYTNPIGLDEPGQHSTARDLVKLGRVLRLQPFARSLVDRPEITLSSGAHARTFKNRNGLVLKYPWANGIKTGHTSGAGWVLVGAGKRNGVQLVSAVLGTPSETARDADSARLLKWGFRQFKVVAYPRPEDLAREAVPIRYRRGARMPLVPGKQLRLVVPRQGDPGVQVRVVKKPADVEGPVFTTTPLGAAQIVRDGKLIRTVPLFAQSYVPKADLAQRTKAAATNPLWVVLAFAALGGTVLLARSRRRNGRPRRRRAREEARAT